MLKNRTISSILRYCKTKPRFLDIVTKTALFQNRTNQGHVIPRPYCISYLQQCIRKFVKNSSQLDQLIVQKLLWCPKHFVLHFVDQNYLPLVFASIIYNLHFHIMYYYRTVHKNPFRYLDAQWARIFKKSAILANKKKFKDCLKS